MTRRWDLSASVGMTLCAWLLLAGCGAKVNEHTEGETHWLSACTQSASCGGDYACVCGVCTQTCEQTSACEQLGEASVCEVATATSYRAECASEQRASSICVRTSDVLDQSTEPDSSTEAATTTEETNTTATDDCALAAVSPQLYEATPRANREAEILAVLAGNDVVATEADYQRAVRDHAAIVALDPRFASFYTSTAKPAVGDNLSIALKDDASGTAFETAARCVNAKYDATMSSNDIGTRYFFDVQLNGVFNLDIVKTEYETLPEVSNVDPVVLTPPPRVLDDEVYVMAVVREDDAWVYSANITKLTCRIHVSIATDGNGGAEVVAWTSTPDELPESAACQRPDPAM